MHTTWHTSDFAASSCPLLTVSREPHRETPCTYRIYEALPYVTSSHTGSPALFSGIRTRLLTAGGRESTRIAAIAASFCYSLHGRLHIDRSVYTNSRSSKRSARTRSNGMLELQTRALSAVSLTHTLTSHTCD